MLTKLCHLDRFIEINGHKMFSNLLIIKPHFMITLRDNKCFEYLGIHIEVKVNILEI